MKCEARDIFDSTESNCNLVDHINNSTNNIMTNIYNNYNNNNIIFENYNQIQQVCKEIDQWNLIMTMSEPSTCDTKLWILWFDSLCEIKACINSTLLKFLKSKT